MIIAGGIVLNNSEMLRNAFWEDDKKQGGMIFNQYQEIKKVLENEDLNFSLQKLKEIKQYAIEHTEFYKDYKVDMPFPVVNKMDIVSMYDAHQSNGKYDLPVHISSTSGSTGTPFSVRQDNMKRKRNIADLKVFGELCNYPTHERMIFFRVFNSHLNRTTEQEDRENIYYVDCSDLSKEHIDEMIQIIIQKKPRIVFSYSTTITELANRILETGINSSEFGLSSVLTAGEGLPDEKRMLAEKAFGCKVYRRYSDMELGILGQDFGDGGKYYLNWGSYYFECLKIESDCPAEYGEVGRIVITDLFNKAMPMIRYDTGDLGIMDCDEDKRLPYFKEIYGRSRDCVYTTDGIMLSPSKIFVSMWEIEDVKQWQFIQKGQTEYLIKIVAENSINDEALIDNFLRILGNNAKITIEILDEIPVLASNKRRAVICEWDPKK